MSAVLAVAEVPLESISYGIVISADAPPAAEPIEVTDLIEKPDPGRVSSRAAITGRYVLGPSVFRALEEVGPDASGELQLTDALRAVLAGGGRVLAVPLAAGERRHDIGTIESCCTTFLRYAFSHPELGATMRAQASALLDDEH